MTASPALTQALTQRAVARSRELLADVDALVATGMARPAAAAWLARIEREAQRQLVASPAAASDDSFELDPRD